MSNQLPLYGVLLAAPLYIPFRTARAIFPHPSMKQSENPADSTQSLTSSRRFLPVLRINHSTPHTSRLYARKGKIQSAVICSC